MYTVQQNLAVFTIHKNWNQNNESDSAQRISHRSDTQNLKHKKVKHDTNQNMK